MVAIDYDFLYDDGDIWYDLKIFFLKYEQSLNIYENQQELVILAWINEYMCAYYCLLIILMALIL